MQPSSARTIEDPRTVLTIVGAGSQPIVDSVGIRREHLIPANRDKVNRSWAQSIQASVTKRGSSARSRESSTHSR